MSRIILLVVTALIAACATTTYNPTAFPYQINTALLQQKPVKNLVIANVNVSGEPKRYKLRKPAARIDSKVKDYLQAHGYKIEPGYLFENAWNQAVRTYGDLYDPTTGRVDANTWRAVMVTTAKTLRETTDIDAIVFTDVIERDAAHSVGMDHLAQWDGVSRKPATASAGSSGISTDFNWNQTVKVATLVITIYSTNLDGLFNSRGGLDTLQVIDTKNAPVYVRRKKPLENDSNIDEGIRLAFHPFIKMKDYPGVDKAAVQNAGKTAEAQK
jgi:hypothetical protein